MCQWSLTRSSSNFQVQVLLQPAVLPVKKVFRSAVKRFNLHWDRESVTASARYTECNWHRPPPAPVQRPGGVSIFRNAGGPAFRSSEFESSEFYRCQSVHWVPVCHRDCHAGPAAVSESWSESKSGLSPGLCERLRPQLGSPALRQSL
jgi:hypothetical protein